MKKIFVVLLTSASCSVGPQQRTFQKVDEDFSKQMWTSCIIQTLLILLNWSYGGADKCRILFHKKSPSQDFFRGTLAAASNCDRIQRFPSQCGFFGPQQTALIENCFSTNETFLDLWIFKVHFFGILFAYITASNQ